MTIPVKKTRYVKNLLEFDKNITKIEQMYLELYMERRQPEITIFKKLDENLISTNLQCKG